MTRRLFLILCLITGLTGATAQEKKVWPKFLEGDECPNGLLFLPAPPDTLSREFVSDLLWHQWGKQQRKDSVRADHARREAALKLDSLCTWLSSVTGVRLSEQLTPLTANLISKVVTDACNATSKAKRHYQRKRPFLYFEEGTLIPADEPSHHTPSYPSSHAASGWAVALVMAELFPELQEALLKWGYDYGESRIIAGYHYRTDVEAGRLAGSAVVARLHAKQEFVDHLKKVKKELNR